MVLQQGHSLPQYCGQVVNYYIYLCVFDYINISIFAQNEIIIVSFEICVSLFCLNISKSASVSSSGESFMFSCRVLMKIFCPRRCWDSTNRSIWSACFFRSERMRQYIPSIFLISCPCARSSDNLPLIPSGDNFVKRESSSGEMRFF